MYVKNRNQLTLLVFLSVRPKAKAGVRNDVFNICERCSGIEIILVSSCVILGADVDFDAGLTDLHDKTNTIFHPSEES